MFWLYILALFIFLVIGIISKFNRKYQLKDNISSLLDFKKKLIDYYNSFGKNYDDYESLCMTSNKIQNIMGPEGLMYYIDPLRGVSVSKWQIIVNGLSLLHEDIHNPIGIRNRNMLDTIIGAINRRIGTLNETINEINFINPIALIVEGYKIIFTYIFDLILNIFFIPKNRFMSARAIITNFISTIAALFTIFEAIRNYFV